MLDQYLPILQSVSLISPPNPSAALSVVNEYSTVIHSTQYWTYGHRPAQRPYCPYAAVSTSKSYPDMLIISIAISISLSNLFFIFLFLFSSNQSLFPSNKTEYSQHIMLFGCTCGGFVTIGESGIALVGLQRGP
jgi:hypothetical protein